MLQAAAAWELSFELADPDRPGEYQGVFDLYHRFATSAWGHGYATEPAVEAMRLVGRDLPDVPVVARVRPGQRRRVAQRAGLLLVGESGHHLLLSLP